MYNSIIDYQEYNDFVKEATLRAENISTIDFDYIVKVS